MKNYVFRNIEVEGTKPMQVESNTCCMVATTFTKTTLSTTTIRITTVNVECCCAKCHIFIMTLSIIFFIVTLSVKFFYLCWVQHFYCYAECRYCECRGAVVLLKICSIDKLHVQTDGTTSLRNKLTCLCTILVVFVKKNHASF